MEEFKESIKDLRKELSDFIKDYYTELVKIWKKITELETSQKYFMIAYCSIFSILTSTIAGVILYWITKNKY